MEPEIVQALLEINRTFYHRFGGAFAQTRRRIQPGIRRILNGLPPGGDWLDLGCGSGALALEWVSGGREGSYTGLDFSAPLLAEAAQTLAAARPGKLRVAFLAADLGSAAWDSHLVGPDFPEKFDGILAFAVLHHIPSASLRLKILSRVRQRLKPGGIFIHSEWQFQNSPRLLARCLPWEKVGLRLQDLEEGDTLLDWRFVLPGQEEEEGLRYVHLFSRFELAGLARSCGFTVTEEFESDGEGGRLGLYQSWKAV